MAKKVVKTTKTWSGFGSIHGSDAARPEIRTSKAAEKNGRSMNAEIVMPGSTPRLKNQSAVRVWLPYRGE